MIIVRLFRGLTLVAGAVESTFEEPEAFFPWSKEALSVVWTTCSALAFLPAAGVVSARFSMAHPTPSNALAPLNLGLAFRHCDEDREEAEEEHACPVEVCPVLLLRE